MMTFDAFRDKWLGVTASEGPNAMTRVDNTHPLGFFVGVDNLKKYQLMLISDFEPRNIASSRAISVAAGKRYDSKWAICFVLVEASVKEEFIHLCWDLVESSRNLSTSQDDINFVLTRFAKWQRLMELGHNGLMSAAAIKGLVGELLFLEHYAIEKYGPFIAVQGWMGPDKSDRDFVYADAWFEIKTADPSATEVTISSVEQLDTDTIGQLVVCFLEKTAPTESNSISLSAQVNAIRRLLEDHTAVLMVFENKLTNIGYIDRREYDDHVFVFRGRRCFEVNGSFPRLRRSTIPSAFQRVSYSISISAIANWELS